MDQIKHHLGKSIIIQENNDAIKERFFDEKIFHFAASGGFFAIIIKLICFELKIKS